MARRAGSSAMIACRSASLRPPQAAISASVRPQPTQRPVWPLTAQTWMHGLEVATDMGPDLSRWISADNQANTLQISFFDNFTLTVDTVYRISISV